jgi:hypothetical protein
MIGGEFTRPTEMLQAKKQTFTSDLFGSIFAPEFRLRVRRARGVYKHK